MEDIVGLDWTDENWTATAVENDACQGPCEG
jgi:hypothetical protein